MTGRVPSHWKRSSLLDNHYLSFKSALSRRRNVSCRFTFCKIVTLILVVFFVSYFIINIRIQRLENQRRNVEFFRGNLIAQPKCKLPTLLLADPEIMKHIQYVMPINCIKEKENNYEDWVVVNGSYAVLTPLAKSKFGSIDCKFSDIIRVNDDKVKLSDSPIRGHVYEFKNTDFVYVSCESSTNTIRWSSFLAAPRSNIDVQPQKSHLNQYAKSNGEKRQLNVLMWGHDSLSRNMFIRKLPVSFSYLTDKLNAIILKGYNIVGDGTPQALIPILTGKTELELPEVRKRKAHASYVDVYPFVWKDFKEKGYLTGYLEDCPKIGTFQYRLKGFQEPPTDFFMRPYYIAAEPHYGEFLSNCMGSIPRHKVLMNYVENILHYKKEIPKFLFSFHSELSHGDINAIQGADQDMVNFLKDLHESDTLNNTILIVFSDHGNRFMKIRESQQGKQEERMPMFMFVFPWWFKAAYPKAFSNFQRNSEILSTPFDIYPTLKDILRLPSLSDEYFSVPNDVKQRELSLFRFIPRERNCQDAFIEPHWCACLQWRKLNSSSPVALRAAAQFVSYLNLVVENQTDLCAPLKINKIISATSLLPSKELIRFKQNADKDGFVPDMSDTMTVSVNTLQLTVETVPGYGHFEVSIRHDLISNNFTVHESEISRINKYGSQAFCIEETFEQLRKYCYCRDTGANNVKSPDKGSLVTKA